MSTPWRRSPAGAMGFGRSTAHGSRHDRCASGRSSSRASGAPARNRQGAGAWRDRRGLRAQPSSAPPDRDEPRAEPRPELRHQNDVRDLPHHATAPHVGAFLQREPDSESVLLELRCEAGELVVATRIVVKDSGAGAVATPLLDGAGADNHPGWVLAARWKHRDDGNESQRDESLHRCLLTPGARILCPHLLRVNHLSGVGRSARTAKRISLRGFGTS